MISKKIIDASIDYILQHIDESLTAEAVAAHFNFSKFYFSRSFKQMTGESVYEFIKRLKMEQSAIDIKLRKNKAITQIGLDYGYSTSNYSTAFRKHHHRSPAEFRKSTVVTGMANPFYLQGSTSFDTFEAYQQKIEIRMLPDCSAVYERTVGNYIDLKKRWARFLSQHKEYIQADTLLIERFYDDPAITGLNNCLCDICITADLSWGLEPMTVIAGGKYAIYPYAGTIRDIFNTIQGVFSIWMPESGYQMDGRCGLNIYREIDWSNERVMMDLCIPVK